MTLKTLILPYALQPEEGESLRLPDDPEPRPESMFQNPSVIYAYYILEAHLRERPGAFVDTNSFVYYDRADRNRRVAPDCYVALGVDAAAIRRRNGYLIWEVGKAPDLALEIASESTASNDLTGIRALYARIGIGEYWRFDPSGGDYYGEALVGERLVAGAYRRLATHRTSSGEVWAHSPALALDLYWTGERLRVYDPQAGEFLKDYSESEETRLAVEAENRQLREQLRRLQGGNGV